jgi:hypothetical protein
LVSSARQVSFGKSDGIPRIVLALEDGMEKSEDFLDGLDFLDRIVWICGSGVELCGNV